MDDHSRPRIGYVLKMYPRFSETFIVNEILAHEAAGLPIEILSLRPPVDGRFHAALAEVKAPVHYISDSNVLASEFWTLLDEAKSEFSGAWEVLCETTALDVRDVMQAIEVARQVRLLGIEHLHAHFATVAATVARLAAALTGISYSFTAHAKDIFHESVVIAELDRLMADASAVVTVSQYNKAYLSERFASANVHVVYNGLDLERFEVKALERCREIVAVGRLIEKKGFEDLIDACSLLAQAGERIHCRIVGGGPLEGALRERIKSHNLEHAISLEGPRPQHEVLAIVAGAAVFAAPCVVGADGNRDGLPTVLLEAMALGTPCIATPVTGIPEIVRNGETGLLVPERSPVDLAHAIQSMLEYPPLGARLATAARQQIEAQFDIHTNTGFQRELFTQAISAVRR